LTSQHNFALSNSKKGWQLSTFLNGLHPAFSLFLGLALLLCFYLVTLPFFALLVHNDLGWHIAAGDLIRATRAIPQVDPWSYTANGQPWVNLAWAWDVVCSIVYEAGGLEYMHLLTFAFGGICFMLVRQLGLTLGGKSWVASLAGLFALAIVPFYGMPDIFFSASPQIASYVLILIFLLVCQGRPSYWLIPVLSLVWVNVHSSFPLGLLTLGLYGLGALVRKDFLRFRRFLVIGAAALSVTLINPYGIDAHALVIRTFGHISQRHISEWQAFHTLLSGPLSYSASPVILFFMIYCFTLIRAWRKKVKLPIEHVVFSLLLFVLSCLQYRYASIWILVSAPLLVLNHRNSNSEVNSYRHTAIALCVYMLALFVIMPQIMRKDYKAGMAPAPFRYPANALKFIADQYPQARVANHWNYGSWMILYHRNQMRPIIDGRALTAYPDELFGHYFNEKNEANSVSIEGLIAAYPADVILWMTIDQKQIAAIKALRGWQTIYSDESATVFAASPLSTK
jgi:hypothetical protein